MDCQGIRICLDFVLPLPENMVYPRSQDAFCNIKHHIQDPLADRNREKMPFFLFFFLKQFIVHRCLCLNKFLCITCVHVPIESRMPCTDPLELELQVVMRHLTVSKHGSSPRSV